MTHDDEEKLLVIRVQNGDLAAFEKLLRRLHTPLRSYVSKMVGDSAADDVLQEISLKIYQKIGLLREPLAFRAWVYRMASRMALVHLGQRKRWQQFGAGAAMMTSGQDDEFDLDLLSMVERISPASRAVLLLHYQQNLSLEETAAILDIPLGTAKSRLSYGIATLRTLIQEKERR